eukprot:TRINITY_DN19526_c0_g1_i2.p2 TRINITY_DN19526_c0_g1~~TRINITY_DN19526_c0_g1_i2.p2  ORF type:complete len:492 (+),score=130.63 TRINITY_DN19526_c0_g1_i2:83-1558(+)
MPPLLQQLAEQLQAPQAAGAAGQEQQLHLEAQRMRQELERLEKKLREAQRAVEEQRLRGDSAVQAAEKLEFTLQYERGRSRRVQAGLSDALQKALHERQLLRDQLKNLQQGESDRVRNRNRVGWEAAAKFRQMLSAAERERDELRLELAQERKKNERGEAAELELEKHLAPLRQQAQALLDATPVESTRDYIAALERTVQNAPAAERQGEAAQATKAAHDFAEIVGLAGQVVSASFQEVERLAALVYALCSRLADAERRAARAEQEVLNAKVFTGRLVLALGEGQAADDAEAGEEADAEMAGNRAAQAVVERYLLDISAAGICIDGLVEQLRAASAAIRQSPDDDGVDDRGRAAGDSVGDRSRSRSRRRGDDDKDDDDRGRLAIRHDDEEDEEDRGRGRRSRSRSRSRGRSRGRRRDRRRRASSRGRRGDYDDEDYSDRRRRRRRDDDGYDARRRSDDDDYDEYDWRRRRRDDDDRYHRRRPRRYDDDDDR